MTNTSKPAPRLESLPAFDTDVARIDFGMCDERGRAIGYVIGSARELKWEDSRGTLRVDVSPTRNGKAYGPGSPIYGNTREELLEKVNACVAGSLKRYAKKLAKR